MRDAHSIVYDKADKYRNEVREFARQIESGRYLSPGFWTVRDETGDAVCSLLELSGDDETEALKRYANLNFGGMVPAGYTVEFGDTEYDEPTITGDEGPVSISEWSSVAPIELRVGRPVQVWLEVGSPDVLIESDLCTYANLDCYHAGIRCRRTGPEVKVVLDYLISPLLEMVPEDYR